MSSRWARRSQVVASQQEVSDRTAFMYLGDLIEFDETKVLFTKPKRKQTEDYITGRYG